MCNIKINKINVGSKGVKILNLENKRIHNITTDRNNVCNQHSTVTKTKYES